jgi:uncharacterized protein YgiM (DUF1202 family)
MAEKKKSFLDKAVDALSSRDEKAAAAKAQEDAEAAKKEAAELKVKLAAQQAAATKAAAEKAAAEKAAAQKAAAERAAAAITAAEKAAAERAAASAPRVLKGKTTGNLKLRSGPGMEYEPPIAYLKPDTELEIVEELENWLKVKVEGKEGYVGKKYVEIQSAPSATPPTKAVGGGVS